MKLVLIIASLALIGCGDLKKEIRRLQTERDQATSRINDLQAQIDALELSVSNNISARSALNIAVAALDANNQTQINTLNAQISALQSQVNLQVQYIAVLQGYTHIYAIINPCGDNPGFDEILLKTSQGLLAYFEQGSNRFLSVLPDGNYQTTDQHRCKFSVFNGEYVK